ncbi:MAG: aspartyl protease [Thermofilum sp.]|jgi:predicted aspartyl protease|nr:aspartyl protease [Thermofilum sp.]MCC6065286.1 aspartyl protease [Thermofilum sp.]
MGFTYVKIRVYSVDLARWEDVEVLVDSGALFTSIPRPVLERLGLKPIARRRFRVYGGGVIERDVGGAVVEYGERRAVVPVVFGEPEDIPVLGATTLESLGYQLDPVSKELKPIELLMI